MATSNPNLLLSSPLRTIASVNMPSSSPLPSPGEIFKRKSPVYRAGSRAGAIPSSSFASFTTASTLCQDSQFDAPARIRSFSALAGSEATAKIGGNMIDQSMSTHDARKVGKTRAAAVTKVAKGKDSLAKRVIKAVAEDGDTPAIVKKVRKAPTKTMASVSDEHDIAPARKVGTRKTTKKRNDPNVEGPEFAIGTSSNKQAASLARISISMEERADVQVGKKSAANNQTKNESKAKAVRKPQAKKPIETSQGLILAENITKPSIRAETVAEICPKKDNIDINLVQATKRKVDWTPPVPVTQPIIISPASRLVLNPMFDDCAALEATKATSFKDLFANFAFVNDNASTTSSRSITKSEEQAIMRKRKLIELVKMSSTEDATSPTKKPAKKKATTITGRATAAYMDLEDDVTPLMQYISAQPKTNSTSSMAPPTKKRRRSPVKGSKQAPILLSPESAMKQVANQDFVFGTSSQLAREESPTLLRDLHEAIEASLGTCDPATDESRLIERQGRLWSAAARTEDGILVSSPERNAMISKAARVNEEAECIGIDQLVEGNNNPESKLKFDALNTLRGPMPQLETEDEVPPPSGQGDSMSVPAAGNQTKIATEPPEIDISNKFADVPLKEKTKAATKKTSTKPRVATRPGLKMPKFETYTSARLSKEIAAYHFKPVKSRDAMIKLLETCWKAKHQAALQAVDPNSASTTSKQFNLPAQSNISPTKKHTTPKKIKTSHLETKTPQSETKISLPETSDLLNAPTTTPVKRPRGRPRKDVTLSSSSPAFEQKPKSPTKVAKKISTAKKTRKKQDSQEEINDSDAQLTPSPPRRKASQVNKPPLPLKLSIDIDLETSPELSSSQEQGELFSHITMAVKTAPRAVDSKNPCWHEKILLYDPIILEDLAIWLNAGNLGRVGYDGEVAPAEVKKWCESKSICCLWKENLRGGNRSRY